MKKFYAICFVLTCLLPGPGCQSNRTEWSPDTAVVLLTSGDEGDLGIYYVSLVDGSGPIKVVDEGGGAWRP